MDKQHRHTNKLINSTSPYLLQHAHNPVDWYPWGEEALERAKKEDKPIIVSIGYSTCHWCHVMERESFENEAIAEVMNKNFICIKVDREERPDVDQVYMEAVQAMGLNGGWPLNVFLTPDQRPFYGGTYYPPKSWEKLLKDIANAFRTRRQDLESSAAALTRHLAQSDVERFKSEAAATELAHDVTAITTKLRSVFDTTWGGMNRAPKFIMPSVWMLLLRCYYLSNDAALLDQINLTLKKIAMGGIHDQIGGGFARYSVDGEWFAPHFEKMLYDNGQLMSLYAEAYAATGDREYKEVIEAFFTWLLREMTHPEGGFFSALDADSEGEEGKYYVWTKSEIEQNLGERAELVCDYYGVTSEGNWEHGNNILIRRETDEEFLTKHQLSPEQWREILTKAKDTLLQIREQRIKPGLDDKIITAWNGIMISGLTHAYRATADTRYRDAAVKAMRFINSHLREGTTLYRSFKGKRSSTTGFLDDYAFTIQAAIDLYEVTFNEDYLEDAASLLRHTLKDFFDEKERYFFYSHHEGESLISRKKEIFDNVIPGSNSVMARNLRRLGLIYDNEEWISLSTEMTTAFADITRAEPNYMSYWGITLLESKQPIAEVVFIGEEAHRLREEFQIGYYPFSVSLGSTTSSNLPLLQGKEALEGKSTVYVCYNKSCRLPVHTVKEAVEQVHYFYPGH
nr:MAG: thioredoxin domain-containing protein [Bacteroidota bacterium]